MAQSNKIRFNTGSGGSQIECEASAGSTVLDIALQNDVPIEHACGGYCSCTTCHIHVLSDMDALSPMDEEERERLGGVDRFSERSRLACQTKILEKPQAGLHQPIVIEVMNVES